MATPGREKDDSRYFFKPRELQGVVRELLGERAEDEQVRFCCLSIIGQCVFLHNARQVIRRVDSKMKYTPSDIENLARHITRFSLGALKQLRKDLENQEPESGVTADVRKRIPSAIGRSASSRRRLRGRLRRARI